MTDCPHGSDMSNAKSIFSSNYAIRLAKDMAESRRVLGPKETFGRLLRFAAIGVAAVAVLIVAVVLLNTDLSSDPNTRTFLLFLSFAAALVLVATIGASLVFLWDSFLGQYITALGTARRHR